MRLVLSTPVFLWPGKQTAKHTLQLWPLRHAEEDCWPVETPPPFPMKTRPLIRNWQGQLDLPGRRDCPCDHPKGQGSSGV